MILMTRFDDFEEWEISEILSGLYTTGPHNKDSLTNKLIEEVRIIQKRKIEEKLSKLPHCKTCNQVIKDD